MNHAVVIDASVAVKWVIYEDFTDQARMLYEHSVLAHRPILVPPHFAGEVVNVIYQRQRTREPARRITEEESDNALSRFSRFLFEPLVIPGLYERAFVFARANRLTNVYDSLYVVLAEMLEAELWTDDRRLINSVGEAAPWVRWIGDYEVA